MTHSIYILSNRSGTLYIGRTDQLGHALERHRAHAVPGFTAKYRIDRLLHVEPFATRDEAAARERQLRGWSRAKKVALIDAGNPEWRDLADVHANLPSLGCGKPPHWKEGPRQAAARRRREELQLVDSEGQ